MKRRAGRPKKPLRAGVFCRFTPEIDDRVRGIAASTGLDISNVVSRIVADALEDGWTAAKSISRREVQP